MLTTLRIKNLALVDDLTIEFQAGFNAITGETGAGKSILIGALNLALGERADRTLLRAGAEQCSVEAVFESGDLAAAVAPVLEEHGLEPCADGQLLLRRVFTAAGANRQFVNGSPTTLALLKQVGELLVDIHGPHEHQSLLHAARQLAILDAFGDLAGQRQRLAALVGRRAEIEARKRELVIDEKTHAQQLDLLRHQVAEIEGAAFRTGDEEQLESDHARASNAAQLLHLARQAVALLEESEASLFDRMGELGRTLHELRAIDASTSELASLHEQSLAVLREIQQRLDRYTDRVEVDPERLAGLEERLDLLQSLKRKYGGTIEEINSFGEAARRRLSALESREGDLARLHAEEAQLRKELVAAAGALTASRTGLLARLGGAVTAELRQLGFARSHFEVALSTGDEVGATGADRCEFLFAPNVGEPPRPLRAIASSGEMSRVMLALKTVLAAQDEVPVLVFDEIDANVGGETAPVVGRKMREIGARRQVLCITHLPAVAAAATVHHEVRKELRDGRTVSSIHRLEGEARVAEIARMLGGGSEVARRHASELLAGSQAPARGRR